MTNLNEVTTIFSHSKPNITMDSAEKTFLF